MYPPPSKTPVRFAYSGIAGVGTGVFLSIIFFHSFRSKSVRVVRFASQGSIWGGYKKRCLYIRLLIQARDARIHEHRFYRCWWGDGLH